VHSSGSGTAGTGKDALQFSESRGAMTVDGAGSRNVAADRRAGLAIDGLREGGPAPRSFEDATLRAASPQSVRSSDSDIRHSNTRPTGYGLIEGTLRGR